MVYSLGYLLCKNENHKFPTPSTRAAHGGDIKDRALLCTEGYQPLRHIKARPAAVYLLTWITWQTGSSWLSRRGQGCSGGWEQHWSPGGSQFCSVSCIPAERQGYVGMRKRRLRAAKLKDHGENLITHTHTNKQYLNDPIVN